MSKLSPDEKLELRKHRRTIIRVFSLLALLVMPALGQEKEEERVENAGKAIKEVMNIPDNVPQT